MFYSQQKPKSSLPGFTIIELLVVIVVIAILAAISIIAYNGIRERSETSQRMTDAKTILTMAALFKAETGDYPNYEKAITQDAGEQNPDLNRAYLKEIGIPSAIIDQAIVCYRSSLITHSMCTAPTGEITKKNIILSLLDPSENIGVVYWDSNDSAWKQMALDNSRPGEAGYLSNGYGKCDGEFSTCTMWSLY